MTLLIAFPLQVIILYLILYGLFLLTYCRITYPLSSSHILSLSGDTGGSADASEYPRERLE
jgi:hypothetical protein